MNYWSFLKHRIGYAARIALLCVLVAGSAPAQAAINYLVLDVTGSINHTYDCCSSTWTDSLTATLSISTSCSTAGVNVANVIYYGASQALQGIPWSSGVPFTARSCLAGVPSSITLTPIPWVGNTATTQTLTLGGASFSMPVNIAVLGGSNCVGASILLPDGRLFGAAVGYTNYASLNWPIAFIGAEKPTSAVVRNSQNGTVSFGLSSGTYDLLSRPVPVFANVASGIGILNLGPIYVLGF